MKVVILLGTDGKDVRSAKICRSMSRLGHEVHFVGWDRRNFGGEREVDGTHFHLMNHRVPLGKSTLWGQFKFATYAAQKLRKIRPDMVYAVNEDNVLRAVLFCKPFYEYLICDFYDSHADRFSEKFFGIRLPVQAASFFCKVIAKRLIVTDRLRWKRLGRFRKKALIIENVPEDPGNHLSIQQLTGETKIFVTGAMNKSRGLGQLLRATDQCPEIRIVAAGQSSDRYAEEVFLKHEKVDYRGVVTPKESLELAASCDAVFAFYAPINQNQIFASPNKLFDAMCVGRPVIMNSEVRISQWATDNSVGLACPYEDVLGLRKIIQSLPERRLSLPSFASMARQIFVKEHSWEIMEKTLGELGSVLEEGKASADRAAA